MQVDPHDLVIMDANTYDQILKFHYKNILTWGTINDTDFILSVYINTNTTMKLILQIQDTNSPMMNILDHTFDEKSYGDIIEENDNNNDDIQENKDNDNDNDNGNNNDNTTTKKEKTSKQKQKDADEKLLEVASPLMQSLSLQDIVIHDIYDSGNFLDKQDPGITIYISNQLFKTERLKEAGTEGTYPEIFGDIQVVAKEVSNGLDLVVEVDNIDAFGHVKAHLGIGSIKVREALPKKEELTEFTINLIHDGKEKGKVTMKGTLSSMHRLRGYPNIHLFNKMIESKNRYYLRGDHIKVSRMTSIIRAVFDQLDLN